MLLDRLSSIPTAIVMLYLDDEIGRAAAHDLLSLTRTASFSPVQVFCEALTDETIPMWQVAWSPTYLVFRAGNEVDRHRGRLERDDLIEFIRRQG